MFKLIASFLIFIFSLNTAKGNVSEVQEIPNFNDEILTDVLTSAPIKKIIIFDNLYTLGHTNSGQNPNTEKVTAYNTQSEKTIGEVAGVAAEKSPVLVTSIPTPEPEQFLPTPSPTTIPIKPPLPTIALPPNPTIHPIKPPDDPCYCPPKHNCIMIACPETI
jgi:hypothetical protein